MYTKPELNQGLSDIGAAIEARSFDNSMIRQQVGMTSVRHNMANFRHSHPFVGVLPIMRALHYVLDGTNAINVNLPDGAVAIAFAQDPTSNVRVSFSGNAKQAADANGIIQDVISNPGRNFPGYLWYTENKQQIQIYSPTANAEISILYFVADDIIVPSSTMGNLESSN